jgi:peptide/nickel transport system permease protein
VSGAAGRSLARAAARRALVVLAAAWLIGSFTFVAGSVAAGDFASQSLGFGAAASRVETLRATLHLDRPLAERYRAWALGLLRLDAGRSVLYGRPAGPLVLERAGHTIVLAALAGVVALGFGIVLGSISGSDRRSWIAQAIAAMSTICVSIPPLLASVLFVWMAAVTGLAPIAASGAYTTGAGDLAGAAAQLIVPALALGVPIAAAIERIQARAVADALATPCIVAARARGVPPGQVVWRHAARLGASSVAATGGVLAGALVSGSLAVELVTSWPGLGRLAVDALYARDVVLAAACAMTAALLVGLLVVLSDAIVVLIDPRMRDTRVPA